MALSFAVSYVAVVVATVAALIIGFIWFMPKVFGGRWLAYLGRPSSRVARLLRHRDDSEHP